MPRALLARMRLGGIALVVLGVSSVASARPVTFGVGAGVIEAEQDWDGQNDGTLQVFGRLGLTSRVSGQLELQKIDSSQTDSVTRTGTALLVVELGRSGRLVPTMFAGLGLDYGENPYGGSEEGSHIEGGFGLEFRLDGGLVIMGDLRLGGRSVNQSETVILDAPMTSIYAPILIEGEYRSARVGVALRF